MRTVIRIKPPCDIESSSLSSSDSADSTLKVSDKRRSKSAKHEDDVVIEATLEFRDEDEGIVYVDGNEVQETITSFWVIDLTEESIEIDTCAVFIGTKWNRQTGEIDIESNDKWREL